MAVAVEIDAILDIGRRQKLRLADLAGIGADQVAQRKIAALDDLQRGDQLALEQFRAAAIMRQGGEHAEDRQLAHVADAVIGLERPDRHQHLRAARRSAARCARAARRAAASSLPGARDAGRRHAGRRRIPRSSCGNMPRWRRSKVSTAGSCVTPAKALSMTGREMPAACASRAIEARKVLKSPPHCAAKAGVARRSVKTKVANGRAIMALDALNRSNTKARFTAFERHGP